MKNILLVLNLSLIVSGCAGLHSMPPNNYSISEDPNSYRLFFDQDGDLYPSSPSATMPTQKKIGRNYGFSIRNHMKKTGQSYNNSTVEAHYNKVAKDISDQLKSDNELKLIFLIHGYNNSYYKANSSYEHIKSFLNAQSENKYLFVEIYWDGLFKGPFSSPLPLAYWFDSMAYSNIAGQVGLRKLINRLPLSTDLTIVTHSRGAGVAFSAFSNPIYDDHIKVPPFEKMDTSKLGDLKIVAIAPAVGNGHPLDELSKLIPNNTKVFIGFNANDPTLKKSYAKIRAGEDRFGDTSLGVNENFYLKVSELANSDRLLLQRVIYEEYQFHGIKGYIDRKDSTKCLFWAAKILSAKPDECNLVQ